MNARTNHGSTKVSLVNWSTSALALREIVKSFGGVEAALQVVQGRMLVLGSGRRLGGGSSSNSARLAMRHSEAAGGFSPANAPSHSVAKEIARGYAGASDARIDDGSMDVAMLKNDDVVGVAVVSVPVVLITPHTFKPLLIDSGARAARSLPSRVKVRRADLRLQRQPLAPRS